MRRSGFKPWLPFRHASLASCIPLHTEPRCPGIRQRKIACAGDVWKRVAWSTVNPEIEQMVQTTSDYYVEYVNSVPISRPQDNEFLAEAPVFAPPLPCSSSTA